MRSLLVAAALALVAAACATAARAPSAAPTAEPAGSRGAPIDAAAVGRAPLAAARPGAAPADGALPGAAILKPGLEPLRYFLGTWEAEVRNPQDGSRARLTYRIEAALDGAWLFGSGESKELGVKIHDLWGRDLLTGEVVRAYFDSNGVWGTVRSKGFQGDVLIFEGEAHADGQAVTLRETITRVGPDEFRAVWEQRAAGGSWQAYSVERLVRAR